MTLASPAKIIPAAGGSSLPGLNPQNHNRVIDMKHLMLISMLMLAGCGGTTMDFSGPLCGGALPATFTLADAKDRSGFEARCTHTTYRQDGTVAAVDEIAITSSDSSASAVIQAQAEALTQLSSALMAAKP
jgi:hypothetical protein